MLNEKEYAIVTSDLQLFYQSSSLNRYKIFRHAAEGNNNSLSITKCEQLRWVFREDNLQEYQHCHAVILTPLLYGVFVTIPCHSLQQASFVCYKHQTNSELNASDFIQQMQFKSENVCQPTFISDKLACTKLVEITLENETLHINLSDICVRQCGDGATIGIEIFWKDVYFLCPSKSIHWCTKASSVFPYLGSHDRRANILSFEKESDTSCSMFNIDATERGMLYHKLTGNINCFKASINELNYTYQASKISDVKPSFYVACQVPRLRLYEFNCDKLRPYYIENDRACVSMIYSRNRRNQQPEIKKTLVRYIPHILCPGENNLLLSHICNGIKECPGNTDEMHCSERQAMDDQVFSKFTKNLTYHNDVDRYIRSYNGSDSCFTLPGCFTEECFPISDICILDTESSRRICTGKVC